MVRYLIFILTLFIFGCETTNQQLINLEKLNFNEIKFETVSKDLSYQNPLNTEDEIIYGKIIDYWFDNKIKTNGFEGNLEVQVIDLKISKFKEDSYYKVEIQLIMSFTEVYESLNKRNLYEVESLEYGEIEGSFSIKDQENLDINIMHENLYNISRKLENIL